MAEKSATGPTEQGSTSNAQGDIVVTAQRRTQLIQDVPYNISAISSSALARSGATNANDLGKIVSGLGTVDEGASSRGNQNNFTLRGLRTDSPGSGITPSQNVNSVSTYYGDTPVFFSLLLKDLERVEVLRGPQGTLYGSGAEGGTIRFLPNRPSFSKFSGEINVSAGFTEHAGFPNESIDGVLNIPLSDKLALRVVAADNRLAGFIDHVNEFERGADNVPVPSIPGDLTSGPVIGPRDTNTNTSNQWMVRTALRYAPTEWLDTEVDYLHQHSKIDDVQQTNPFYSGKEEDVSTGLYPAAGFVTNPGGKYVSTSPYRQPYDDQINLVSGTATVDFGFASLTSVTSYYKSEASSVSDLTGAYLPGTFNFLVGYHFYPRFTALSSVTTQQTGFVEEARLVSQGDTRLSYVLGLYYERDRSRSALAQSAPGLKLFSEAIGTPGANATDSIFSTNSRSHASDKAVFGEVTFKVTPKWSVMGGFRVFKDSFSTTFEQQFPYGGASFGDGSSEPLDLGTTRASSAQNVSNHIFKVNTSYDFSRAAKIYATVSRGFRRGGTNGLPITGPYASLPQFLSYKPDFATNYEVGIKGVVARRVRYSIDGFLIDLKNFQFNAFTPSFLAGTFNGQLARSKGIEAETQIRVSSNLELSAGYAFTDAKVIKGVNIFDLAPFGLYLLGTPTSLASSISTGTRLPGVSKHTVNGNVDYTIPLSGPNSILIHFDANYRTSQHGNIDTSSINYWRIPATFMSDFRLTYFSGNQWSLSAFVTNINNSIGYSGASGVQVTPSLYSSRVISRPRTIGVAIHNSF